jgi:hypothetical protein
MFIVPLVGDMIETKDGGELKVLAYTNYKTKGPAVYVDHEAGTPDVAIYFFDIEKINGVNVKFNNTAKVFEALGKVKRRIHLPQPHDTIVVIKANTELVDSENDTVQVKSLKLHNKTIGLARGLVIIGEDDNVYRLEDIIDIKRATGGDLNFTRKKFLTIYKEYRGYIGK